MNDHTRKEDGIEPREGALKPSNQTPRHSEEKIARVVNLSSLSVPTIAQNAVAPAGGNSLRVVNLAVLEIREGGTLIHSAALFLTELVLLAVGRIPYVVGAEIGNGKKSSEPDGPLVLRWVVSCDEEGAVAVGERNTSHVPEDKHEAKLLIVHVPGEISFDEKLHAAEDLPCGDDQVLTL